jgi:outer membrane protein OmpA-like peptidoglycan-associated protein
MVKKYSIILITLLFSLIALNNQSYSQFKDYSFKLGIQGNYLIPGNEFSHKENNLSMLFRPYTAIPLSKMFNLGLGIGYGWLQGEDYGGNKYQTGFIPVDLRLSFAPFNSKVINPYLYLGVGVTSWWLDTNPINPPAESQEGINGLGELGLGFEVALNKHWVLDLSGGFNIFSDDKVNGVATNLQNKTLHDYDRYLNFGLGIAYVFESCHTDVDNDGLERCDEEKLGTDPNKADTDGDGLLDGEEVMKYKTNPLDPDTDKDGLKDGEEVMTYKTDPNKADTDGDGLKDGEEVMKYKTDPLKADTDGDGLNDSDEIMMYKTDPLNADTDGDGLKDGEEVMKYKTDPLNPDTDKDGLKDGEEVMKYKTNPLNPDTDGGTINDGVEVNRGTNPLDASDDVPKVLKVEVGKPIVLEGIKFKTASSEILPESEEILKLALSTLKYYKEMEVEIAGHTDNVGKKAYNQKLSESRAQSVKTWLVNQGIDAKRITTKGYGFSKPMATNKTAEGKAKNRRIEFVRTK